jgi:hypothetical protein
MDAASQAASREQHALNRQLWYGVVFSLIWLFGLGSLYSFIQGIRALRTIRESDYPLQGTLRAWWCVVVGGLGTIFLLCLALSIVLYYLGIESR